MTTFLAASMLCLSAQAAPMPVILDTDIGGDIDDTWALCMMLASPELDVRLVTTAYSDTPAKTRLTAKILERVGRTDIPIGTGRKTEGKPLNQLQWIEGYSLEDYPGVVHEDGVQALIDTVKAAPEPITLCVLGPQTNIAEALKRDPSIADNARIVAMAGSVHIGYRDKPEPDAEWNVRANVESARAVFAAPWDIAFAPLDTCGNLRLVGERYQKIADAESPLAKVTLENYAIWRHRHHYPEGESSILFDTLAVYLCFSREFVAMEEVLLSIDDKGFTRVDPENGRPVACALSWNDEAAFKDLLVERMTRKPVARK